MAKLHSASPREITSPFTREIISELHSHYYVLKFKPYILLIMMGKLGKYRTLQYSPVNLRFDLKLIATKGILSVS